MGFSLNSKTLINFIVVFIILQFTFSILQYFNVAFAIKFPEFINSLISSSNHGLSIENHPFFERARGTFLYEHIFAGVFATIYYYYIVFNFFSEKKKKLNFILIILIGIITIFTTFSRSAMVSGIVMLTFLLFHVFFKSSHKNKLKTIIGLLFIVLLIMFFVTKINYSESANFYRLTAFGQQNSTSDADRVGTYMIAFKGFLSNPVFGTGYLTPKNSGISLGIHSVPLKMFSSYGLIGGLIYTIMILRLFMFCYKNFRYKEGKAFSIALFTMLFDSLVHTSGLFFNGIEVTFLFGLFFGLVLKNKDSLNY